MSTLSPEYYRVARSRSVVDYLKRCLLKTLDADIPASEVVICEELPRNESEVPQEDLTAMMSILERWENNERQKMNRFSHVRNDLPPFLADPADPADPEATKTDDGTSTAQPPSAKKRRKPQP